MMRSYEIQPHLQNILSKLAKRDKELYVRILKKIEEILTTDDLEHFKNLRYDLKDRKRVHIGHYVLVFKFIKDQNRIVFLDFDHHDKIYI